MSQLRRIIEFRNDKQFNYFIDFFGDYFAENFSGLEVPKVEKLFDFEQTPWYPEEIKNSIKDCLGNVCILTFEEKYNLRTSFLKLEHVMTSFTKLNIFKAYYPDYEIELIEHISETLSSTEDQKNPLYMINFDENLASTYSTNSKQSIIAVVDTGVDIDHPNLIKSLEKLDSKIHPDSYGFNLTNPNMQIGYDVNDEDDHGTNINGILGVHDSSYLTSISPNTKLLNIKAYNQDDSLQKKFISNICRAMILILGIKNVSVINNSWSVPGDSKEIECPCFECLLGLLNKAGIISVFAAGNFKDDSDLYPQLLEEEIINVGAFIKKDDSYLRSGASNYGKNVHIWAPGVNIISTTNDGDFFTVSGTSIAAPFVTGVISLLKSKYPNYNVKQIKAKIQNNCAYLGEEQRDGYLLDYRKTLI